MLTIRSCRERERERESRAHDLRQPAAERGLVL